MKMTQRRLRRGRRRFTLQINQVDNDGDVFAADDDVNSLMMMIGQLMMVMNSGSVIVNALNGDQICKNSNVHNVCINLVFIKLVSIENTFRQNASMIFIHKYAFNIKQGVM